LGIQKLGSSRNSLVQIYDSPVWHGVWPLRVRQALKHFAFKV
jgi:hypothetical protein